ncbi:hypothetical protein OAQ47_05290 [Paracoccaceae bacterium]|nr:hypothetical protein [Paracoccaceae bacterium]
MIYFPKKPFYMTLMLSCLLPMHVAFANSQHRAVVTICETALQTNDQGTIQSMALQMKNWRSLRDDTMIKRAETCLQTGLDTGYFYSKPNERFEIKQARVANINLLKDIEKLHKDLVRLCLFLAKQTPKAALEHPICTALWSAN